MSHYDWEEGSIVLSTKELAAFRKAAAEHYNKALLADFEQLGKLAAALKLAGKGKRGFDFRAALSTELTRTVRVAWEGTSAVWKFKLLDDDDAAIMGLLLDKAGKLVTLKKSAFKLASVRSDMAYPPQHCPAYTDGSFHFDAAKRTVTWCVSEGNHACERARESHMGRFFFSYLKKVVWTRGTGGVIVGNDEYNRDDREYGGGANYTKDHFGPRGAAELEARLKPLTRIRRKTTPRKK